MNKSSQTENHSVVLYPESLCCSFVVFLWFCYLVGWLVRLLYCGSGGGGSVLSFAGLVCSESRCCSGHFKPQRCDVTHSIVLPLRWQTNITAIFIHLSFRLPISPSLHPSLHLSSSDSALISFARCLTVPFVILFYLFSSSFPTKCSFITACSTSTGITKVCVCVCRDSLYSLSVSLIDDVLCQSNLIT